MDCATNNSATLNADDLEHQLINNATQQDQGELEMTAIMAVNKGKRTKRHRLHTSDSSSPVLSASINDRIIEEDDDDDDDELQLDMAECLILLAQGQSRPSSSYSLLPVSVCRDRLGRRLSGSKRRRSSSSLSFDLAAGVYECQTCNRTFPSFQALGGHRASHKKLTTTAAAISNSHHDYFIHPLSLQLGNKNYIRAQSKDIDNKKSNNKIHECTICGAEFSSGQALGGHMRRHRGSVAPLNPSTSATSINTIVANTTLSLNTNINSAAAGKVVDRINDNDESFLSLDLNLPASSSPELDTKISLHPKQQSAAAMAFASTPALVNCFHF